MNELANIFIQRWAVITVGALTLAILLLAPLLAHNASITAQVKALYSSQGGQSTYGDSANVVTNAFSQMGSDAGQAMDTVKLKTLSSIIQASAGITRFDKGIGQAAHTTAVITSYGISRGAALTGHAIVASFSGALHTAGNGFSFAARTTADGLSFTRRTVGDGFSFARRTVSKGFGFIGGLTNVNVSALIRSSDHTPAPTIKQMRAQEASIIQSGTIALATQAAQAAATITTGAGGACDSGEGNGGYPMSWCNAPMDSLPTISFSNSQINRECTSYAYWYFTTVEGHTNFHTSGNAKYWATSTNYPTHAAPAVGAIAVETAGAYGHVAIVQAMPGQTYAGRVVPAGYVVVSEMNYDWHGHFRYSYSPLSKFARYVYP